MTYTLTAEQLADLQFDLDLGNAQLTLTDAQLNRQFDRAVGDFYTAELYAAYKLQMMAAKLYPYSVGVTSVHKEVVFDHLAKIIARLERITGLGGGKLRTGVMHLGLNQTDEEDLEE